MILKKIGLSLLILSTVLISSCGSGLSPTALASDVQNTVEKIRLDSNKVFEDVQRNIDLTTELRQIVEASKVSGETISLKRLIKEITIVTESYEKLSSQRLDIKHRLLKRVSVIQGMKSKVDTEIEALRLRQMDYLVQISQIENPNLEVSRLHEKSLAKAINYIDLQIQLWITFDQIDQAILLEMDRIGQTIDNFLGAISGSAIVFREGLNLLKLQQSIEEALSLFDKDIPRMDQLKQDMETSWDTLDYLINNLMSLEVIVQD